MRSTMWLLPLLSVVGWPFVLTASTLTSPHDLQTRVEQGALLYFNENSNPTTGLTLDTVKNVGTRDVQNRSASLAATGFSLAVMANAADRGLADKTAVYQNSLKTLHFVRDHLVRWHGWFYHYVDWETGERVGLTEFSTIDTALFIAGALYTGTIFPQTELAALAHQMYVDVDFQIFLTDGGTRPKKRTLSMGYIPESGFIATQWDMYAEEMILLVLGLGHPTHPLPSEAWLAFSREKRGDLMGHDQALFVHQYPQLFLDLRNFDDGFPNYFQNSRGISLHQREIGHTDTRFKTLRAGFWGFSAGLAPDNSYIVTNAVNYTSTVCIECAIASVMFAPQEILTDFQAWTDGPYGSQIWGRYGLIDSLDLDQNWFADAVFGITVGPAYLAFANLTPETSVWRKFMTIPEIQHALTQAMQLR